MSVADDLYLLFINTKETINKTVLDWETHFEWLEEVVQNAREARGQAIIPKTPSARRRKRRKLEDEGLTFKPPTAPPLTDVSNVSGTLRKSSRAAAKHATEKARANLLQQANINAKLRRPSDFDQTNKENSVQNKRVAIVDPVNTEEVSPTKSTRGDSGFGSEKHSPQAVKHFIKEESFEPDIMDVESTNPISNLEELLKPRKMEEEIVHDDLSKPEVVVENVRPIRSTRTRQRLVEEEQKLLEVNKSSQAEDEVSTRSTRTKKRQQEEQIVPELEEQRPTRSTRTKQKDKEEPIIQTEAPIEIPKRMTRSKVRLISASSQNSPSKTSEHSTPTNPNRTFNRECCTPKSDKKLPTDSTSYTPQSPYRSQRVKDVVDSRDNPGCSSDTGTHKQVTKSCSVKVNKIKKVQPYNTPTMSSSHKTKVHSVYNSGSSGNIFASSKRKPISSASPVVSRNRLMGTPTESNRSKNIVYGVNSFITKVQPPKANLEELRRDEFKKRQEKVEEAKWKKEEALKLKAEEQKRKNEERMRRVQESREARERKALEDRKHQELEKKLREERSKKERIKEEERRKKLAKEAELQKMREQEEQLRVKQEKRKAEEERRIRLEEEKKMAEERKLRLEEEKRLKAEEQRRIKMEEQARILEKKRLEKERIEREKRELELMKLKEVQQNQNATFTAEPAPADATFSTSTTKSKDSYEMTPVAKPKKKKILNPNDYGIDDLNSEASTDEERDPKKEIPIWAKGDQLRLALFEQVHYPPNVDDIFPSKVLLMMPDLNDIFRLCKPEKKKRFNSRTSSANWNTPPHKMI